MNVKKISITCIITCIGGALLFAYQYEWIIIRLPQSTHIPEQQTKIKRIAQLHYWQDHRWHTETEELIWSGQTMQTIHQLVTNWLSLLDAEQITPKKITLQSTSIAPNNQDVYISFDRNPFAKEWSIHTKLMLIEGLLKTIRSNNIEISHISFLIHHQPLQDPHLDFSVPWPIFGFLST